MTSPSSFNLDLSLFDMDTFISDTNILRLILYRNKNQHQITTWWPHASKLLKRCEQLIDVCKEQIWFESSESIEKLGDFIGKRKAEKTPKGGKVSKREMKRRVMYTKKLEFLKRLNLQETGKDLSSLLSYDPSTDIQKGSNKPGTQQKLKYIPPGTKKRHAKILNIATFVMNTLAPGCYRAFHGIIKLGFFVTLGFGLVAILARLWRLLQEIVQQSATQKEILEMNQRQMEMERQLVKQDNLSKKTDIENGFLVQQENSGEEMSKEEVQQYLMSYTQESSEMSEKTKHTDDLWTTTSSKKRKLKKKHSEKTEEKLKSISIHKNQESKIDSSIKDTEEADIKPKKNKKKNKRELDSIFDNFGIDKPKVKKLKTKEAKEGTKHNSGLSDSKTRKKSKNKNDLDAIFGSF